MKNMMKVFKTVDKDTANEVRSLGLGSGVSFEKNPAKQETTSKKNSDGAGDNVFLMDPLNGFTTMYLEGAGGQSWQYHEQWLYLYRKDEKGEIKPWEPKPDLTCSPFGLYRAIYSWWEDTKEIFGNLTNMLDKVRIGLLGGILLGLAFMIIMVASEIGK
jgi:hypothetical protein